MMRFLVLSLLTFSFTHTLRAQDNLCDNGYLPFRQGVTFELTSFNAKGKEGSVVRHEITDLQKKGDGFEATVNMQIKDDKGNPAQGGTYAIICSDELLMVDMQSMLSPETFAAFGSMEVEITGDALSIPHRLQPGQTLPDAEMVVSASMSGMTLINMRLAITNRKVTGNEQVTTSAGVFDCVKLSQSTTISGMGSRTYDSTTWFARGVGTVRVENYNKKGALDSYSELTHFSK